MIDTKIRIHDKFSVEFKIGFYTSNRVRDINDFKINTWVFVPNGLDINNFTYTKEQFYSDIKSNVRLITPVYSLTDILTEGKGPFFRLDKAIKKYSEEPGESNAEIYTYHTKMLLCILKSAYRETVNHLKEESDEEQLLVSSQQENVDSSLRAVRNEPAKQSRKTVDYFGQALAMTQHNMTDKTLDSVHKYVENITEINARFRNIRNDILQRPGFPKELKEYFLFGDEYLSFITLEGVYELLRHLHGKSVFPQIKPLLADLIKNEDENRKKMGYSVPSEKEEEHNSLMLIKRSLLKKFVESDLYLQRIKKPDGAIAREFYYSIAAGLAMIFATVISFIATQRFGNFTMALFLALVVSYMFKDRIKEMARFYFSSKLDQKYFDWKWDVSLRNHKIGEIKEAFDFIGENKIPEEIHQLRNKTSLMKAENEVYDEKQILYRKRVSISKKDMDKFEEYRLCGINDIIRFNLLSFTKKMDNPNIPLYIPDEKGETGYKTIMGKRVYALYFILQCSSEEETYYKKYRVLVNRDGISDVTEIN